MSDLETEFVLEPEVSPSAIDLRHLPPSPRWKPAAIANDIATLGAGTLCAGLFNVVLVFIIPKLTGIEDYGYWRLFLLYASYAGILHLGLVDGALLTWLGKPLEEFRDELSPLMKFLLWQNVAILLALGLAIQFAPSSQLRFVWLAVIGVSLVQNLTTLLQVALQASRHFLPVAISTAGPLGILLTFFLIGTHFSALGYRDLILLYSLGWIATLAWLVWTVKPWVRTRRLSTRGFGRTLIWIGWPITLGNASLAFAQQLDRFAVSWVADIRDFAMYSLAASAVAVPMLVVQAAYKVIFPHLACVELERRPLIYQKVSRLLLFAWIVLLPYYFLLRAFIPRFLARYVSSIAIAKVLLLGVVFLASVQILHMSFSYLHGQQKRFLVRTLIMIALGLVLAVFTAVSFGTLIGVSVAEVATLGVWWFFNEWEMRLLTGQHWSEWLRFVGIVCITAAGYLLADYSGSPAMAAFLYCSWAAVIVLITCRPELKLIISLMSHPLQGRL